MDTSPVMVTRYRSGHSGMKIPAIRPERVVIEEKYMVPDNTRCGYNAGGFQSFTVSNGITVNEVTGKHNPLTRANLEYFMNYSLKQYAGITPKSLKV